MHGRCRRIAIDRPRRKTPRTLGASVFSYTARRGQTDINQWHFEGSLGKVNKFNVVFSSTLAAKVF